MELMTLTPNFTPNEMLQRNPPPFLYNYLGIYKTDFAGEVFIEDHKDEFIKVIHRYETFCTTAA